MKQELLKGKTGTLAFTPYLNNRPAIATSATATIFDFGGAQLATGSASVNATTGEITYSVDAAYTAKLGENYQIQWDYVIATVHYYRTNLYDVVLNRLSIPVIDADLLNEQNDLMDGAESFAGAVDSSANTTLVASDLKNFPDDHWNGGKVSIINPADGVKQVRDVTDFVSSSGTISIGIAWASNPTNAYTFEVKRGFQKKIEAAFEEMLLDVRSKGFRPALILESVELKVPLIKKAIAMICRDFIVSPDDKWSKLANEYEAQYASTFSKVVFQYDKNESGFISDNEKSQDMGNVRLKR